MKNYQVEFEWVQKARKKVKNKHQLKGEQNFVK